MMIKLILNLYLSPIIFSHPPPPWKPENTQTYYEHSIVKGSLRQKEDTMSVLNRRGKCGVDFPLWTIGRSILITAREELSEDYECDSK